MAYFIQGAYLKSRLLYKLPTYMPAKNSIKTYVKNGYYHLYNRGVNKAPIFFEESDYRMFLYLLKLYLSDPVESKKLLINSSSNFIYTPKNFYKEITLIAFVLMPNHFHFLVKQSDSRSIESFMRAFIIKYVLYIKKKYDRVGPLFQGSYKGVRVTSDAYLLHLSRYIHRNPIDLDARVSCFEKQWHSYTDYPFSSYRWYLQKTHVKWFDPSVILNFFSAKPVWLTKNTLSYQSFVDRYQKGYSNSLKNMLIDR